MKLKKIAAVFVVLILIASGCASAGKNLVSGKGNLKYAETDSGVIITSDTAMMSVEFMDPSIIYVSWSKKNAGQKNTGVSDLMKPERPKITVTESEEGLEISSYLLKARVDMASGATSYSDSRGNMLLAEKGRFVEEKGDSYSVKQEFIFRPWEALYGMGKSFNGALNLNGAEEFPVKPFSEHPALFSTTGYGILWAEGGPFSFSGKADDSYISADNAAGIDYFFIYGGSMNKAAGLCAKITGKRSPAWKAAPDECAGWDMLRGYIADAVSLSMSGVPIENGTETNDIRVNYPEGFADPAYRELYTRFNQFLALCPVTFTAGVLPEEIKDDKNRNALVKTAELRNMLEPYIRSNAWLTAKGGAPYIRPLAADFFGDDKALKAEGQYMSGNNIMVSPVTMEMFDFSSNRADFIRPSMFYDPESGRKGIRLMVFPEGTDAKGHELTIDGPYWTMPPEDSNYTINFTGSFNAAETGNYEILVVSDGHVKLSIDGTVLIDGRQNNKLSRFKARAKFKKDKVYGLKAEYSHNTPGKGVFAMQWVKPKDMEKAQKGFKVYLPSVSSWYDFWTGEKMSGGKTLSLTPALDKIPLFVPEGSIIPLASKQKKTGEEILELRVYTGKDARFSVFDYEGEKCAEIPVTWKQKADVLIIGKRNGEWEGMKKERMISVYFTDKKHGKGLEPGMPDRQVIYKGEEIVVEKK